MCKNLLAEEMFKELDEYIGSLENKGGSLITVLHKAQEIFGYLPKEVQLHVARRLDTTAAKVNGVVTFYSYFTEEPKGEHVINVCLGTACYVRGAESILKEIEKTLKIRAGGITEDGKFSLDGLRCVGACGLAPVVIVDGKVFGRVKIEEVEGILENYK
ncbi:MAG TPA: NAD(P)H-dependent oxidoreductase subunit E [Pseudobacteroides sp.]|uniref:NADH-quinone oxidoreductase subunit NuoE family protein n=1 Tax=Pseudobacteroides sp. TaxID=1968840 RepID=UPI002F926DF6